jgi:5-formyltetrahydrofolate cyclo-ligase
VGRDARPDCPRAAADGSAGCHLAPLADAALARRVTGDARRGAEQAAARLADLPKWQTARVVNANPDSPQLPVRRRALADGKVVYMAVPRLAAKDVVRPRGSPCRRAR